MNYELVKDIVGIVLIISGFFDAYKYVWQAQKIRKVQSAKGQSRKFINAALVNDMIRLLYVSLIGDLFLLFVTVIALFSMSYMFWTIYIFYPYRHRNLLNFKRPNLFIYTINSILPNRLRKKL